MPSPWRAGIKADVERANRKKEKKMQLDDYCNSSASDRFHGNPHDDEEPEENDGDFEYELYIAKEIEQ